MSSIDTQRKVAMGFADGQLGQLYRVTLPVDWLRVFDERSACACVDLPSYPFDSQKFWVLDRLFRRQIPRRVRWVVCNDSAPRWPTDGEELLSA